MSMSRSRQMGRVRQVDTAPEVLIRRELWRRGLRYRVAMRISGARPDLVFTKQRLVVFIDGCFWHGCPMHYTTPRSQRDFWSSKLRSNFERDRRQTRVLLEDGWRVVRLWEHEATDPASACDVIQAALDDIGVQPTTCLYRVVSVDVVDPGEDVERRVLEDLLCEGSRYEIVAPRNTRGSIVRRRR